MAGVTNKPGQIQAHLSQVIQELQRAQTGIDARQQLIRDIENLDSTNPRRLLLYIANTDNPSSSVSPNDTVPLGDALGAMGEVENLDLMVHTFGGSGETAEKIVEMCRSHCKKEFRVIVPNMAKSAGTLIAIGADCIVMGYCSELGPIDPQISISASNAHQQVSAWTFIHARDELIEKIRTANKNRTDASPYLQQLASIDPVFVMHCEQLMTFAKRVGGKWITDRLKKLGSNQRKADRDASNVIDFLSDVKAHTTHGRLISSKELLDNCKPGLNIVELPENSVEWQKLWQLYIRCEVFVRMPQPQQRPTSKLIETADVSLALG